MEIRLTDEEMAAVKKSSASGRPPESEVEDYLVFSNEMLQVRDPKKLARVTEAFLKMGTAA